MGDIGHGYGSEWHLLRWLGRHRADLTRRVIRVIRDAETVEWLDFHFDPGKKPWYDAEWESLDFLPTESAVRGAWREFWPHGRGIQTWDAVARLRVADREEWLLVEAKAHVGELATTCKAGERSLQRIRAAFQETKRTLGVPDDRNWLTGCYQYCNRVAALQFLTKHNVPARLLFVYFLGDSVPGAVCPPDEAGWRVALDKQAVAVGLPSGHPLMDRIQTLFLPVSA